MIKQQSQAKEFATSGNLKKYFVVVEQFRGIITNFATEELNIAVEKLDVKSLEKHKPLYKISTIDGNSSAYTIRFLDNSYIKTYEGIWETYDNDHLCSQEVL